MCVTRFLFVLISCLLGIAICVSALHRVDLPETAFNEADATLNVVLPVRHHVQERSEVLAMLLIPLLYRGRCVVERLAFRPGSHAGSPTSKSSAGVPLYIPDLKSLNR
jgi:hypothetical protein